MVDFMLSDSDRAVAERTSAFIAGTVIPYESDERWTSHGPTDELRRELQSQARSAGLLSPHAPVDLGGLGLTQLGRAAVFEEAGYSALGPVALNIAAPDEGNAHLLAEVATPEQRARWLIPLVAGDIRTSFAMTEPAPGAGSDPRLLSTTAVRDGEVFRINGTKWLITGARGAAVFIVMARDSDSDEATMFLVPADASGVVVERDLNTIDSAFVGGHGVVRFDDVVVHETEVLGEIGKGFGYAQVRLGPARLSHCMRWLGGARRAHDVAASYAATRTAFGRRLGEHEGVGFMLADNEVDLRTARLHILYAAWILDQGMPGNEETSIAKTVCSEAVWRVVDRAMQTLGGLGTTDETPVARLFNDIRAFRIYDGPSEVHRWSIARRSLRRAEQ